jgi:hypothetical protein
MALRTLTWLTGDSLMTVLHDRSTGVKLWWNTGTEAFEAYNASHIALYGIDVTEDSDEDGEYEWTVPEELPALSGTNEYRAVTYQVAGASLAVSDMTDDTKVWITSFRWNGSDFAGPDDVDGPTDPSYVVGYLDCFDGEHQLLAGVLVEFRYRDTEASGESHPGKPFAAKSPTNGRLTANFKASTDYEGRRENGTWVAFTSASSGTFALPGILGGE